MASSNSSENVVVQPTKICRCGEGDTNFWTTGVGDTSEKQRDRCPNCEVLKCGTLLLSSKGIGWTSWKKRWFILTRKSLVFFRSDPATLLQKENEPNLMLGGIDLNNSGKVEVKADKKLLTVLFPDGGDGRAFTLKAETSEDLNDWKIALENALAQAPSLAQATEQNGNSGNDVNEPVDSSSEQVEQDTKPPVSTVIGQPVQIALEDTDGSPSFLEKALRFIEQHGIKVEGILRQSADVEEVKRRVQEYEQGKVEFHPDEDAHVIGDCIKHVLRELPSSPVPASCCTALVEAYRTDREHRIDAMRDTIYETFPEPNLNLLQRILKMMQIVASHKTQNRMSLSALAACMAPLLLRPLLAGDCQFDDDFTMGGDGSIQLLKAAAAANHAQAIVIILLEEYDNVFDEDLLDDDYLSSEPYSEFEDGDVEDYESTDNDLTEHDEYHDEHQENEADIDEDPNKLSSESMSESSSDIASDPHHEKVNDNYDMHATSLKDDDVVDATKTFAETSHNLIQDVEDHDSFFTSGISFPEAATSQKNEGQHDSSNASSISDYSDKSIENISTLTSPKPKLDEQDSPSTNTKFKDIGNKTLQLTRRPTVWGRTSARKNLSMESIDLSSEDEIAIQKLENTVTDLQKKIAKEMKGNDDLKASLDRRKEALVERRLALERDVKRLREQLQKERDLRASLESGLMNMRPGHISYASSLDSKTRTDLEEVALAEGEVIALKQKVADLRGQLNFQLQQSYVTLCESCKGCLYTKDQSLKKDQLEDVKCESPLDQSEKDAQSGTFRDISGKEQESPSIKGTERLKNRKPVSSVNQNNSITAAACRSSSAEHSTNVESSTKNKNSGIEVDTEKVNSRNLDTSSVPNNQYNEEQQPSNEKLASFKHQGSTSSSSYKDPTTSETKGAEKRAPTRAEEALSSAAAITKLTNRLMFLKERRAQIVAEMKNSEIYCPVDLDGPPPRTNSR